MSPKSRGRKRKPGARARPASQSPDTLITAAQRLADAMYAACEPFRALAGDDADPLEAELRAATLQADLSRTWSELDIALGMPALANCYPEPHVAGAVAATQRFTPSRGHSTALDNLHARGVRLPAWANRLGHVTPRQAWRYWDIFGERETILVSFAYDSPAGSSPTADSPAGSSPTADSPAGSSPAGSFPAGSFPADAGGEHAILVEVGYCPGPQLTGARVAHAVDDLPGVTETATGLDSLPAKLEEIDLGEAGWHLLSALDHPHRYCTDEALTWIPVLRARVELLVENDDLDPESRVWDEPWAEGALESHADATSTVRSFQAEVPLPTGVDADAFAFWARVMTLRADAAGSSPDRIGPLWLGHVLGEYAPVTFELSPEQQAALVPAVTAWARWAAGRHGLPQTAIDRLADQVAEIGPLFDETYANPERAAHRAYLSDVTGQVRDGRQLEQIRVRRYHALPMPAFRPPGTRDLPVNDRGNRHQILAEELDAWKLAGTESVAGWLAALTSVSDQLWDAEPPELADVASNYFTSDYLADGCEANLLQDLTKLAVEHATDRAQFLEAARNRLTPYDEW